AEILSSVLIGFYRGLRRLPNEQKLRIIDRLGLIIVGGDLRFTLNFLKGLVMGFFLDGLLGIIQMVIDIICFIPKIINFFSSLTDFIKNIPNELADLSKALDSLAETINIFLLDGIQEIYE